MWWSWAMAGASEVTVGVDRYRDLVSPPPVEPAPAPFVERRDVVVRTRGDELVVEARFRVAVPEPGPVAFTVAGPELRVERFAVDGRITALGGGDGGPVYAAALDRPVELLLVGAISAADRATVHLLGAGAGELALPADLVLEDGLRVGPSRWVPAAPDRTLDTLVLTSAPPPPSDRGTLVFGRVGYGVTVLDGELRRAARLQWGVVSGSVDRVAFTIPGAGPDLRVEGRAVGEVSRAGDRVEVRLTAPEPEVVELLVHTSSALGTGEVTTVDLGLPGLDGVFRTDSTVVLARDGELDVVPRLEGLGPRSVLSLPDLVQGLVDATPSAAFHGSSGRGALDVLRYTPAEGPATLCDVATYTVALSEDGRALLRAHWTMRNDRGHLLRITPPPGYEPVAAQVSQRPVTVSRDGDAWLVPLDKSVESVAGLLTFPVEVAFLGREAPVEARTLQRPLPLPSIDVETAVVRATVHLPPGFADRSRVGRGDRVAAFSEGQGITYGFATGDVRAAQAEQYWQDALSSWVGNDFDAAQDALDQIRDLGGANDNTLALQGNLDVVAGNKSGGESSIDRRIKDQARARALEDFEEQRLLLEEAERATNEGRYDEAEVAYQSASAVTEKLAKLANEEDVAQTEQLVVTKQKSVMNTETLNRKLAYRSQANTAPVEEAPAKDVAESSWKRDQDARDQEESVEQAKAEVEARAAAEAAAVVALRGEVAAAEAAARQGSGEGGGGRVTISNQQIVILEPTPVAPGDLVTATGGAPSPQHGRARPAPATTPDGNTRGPPRPAVVATSASVVVPTDGEAVRYQHLLLPSGQALSLELRARRANRSRSHE